MARARLAAMHAQLDEARYLPFSFWSASAKTGFSPISPGIPSYAAAPPDRTTPILGTLEPFFQMSMSGLVPLYTFGKIASGERAAEAQVRVGEWDVEKNRQQVRADVRRAYFGLMAARDAAYLAADVREKLAKRMDTLSRRIEEGDTRVDEDDRSRLEMYRDELESRAGEAKRGESLTAAALRFLTGVSSGFDIPDAPLSRPRVLLQSIARYLTAARIHRAEPNMARAGVAARKAQVDLARANLFPNIGIALGFNYGVAPTPTNPINGFTPFAAFGLEWGLDLLPKKARLEAAEAQLEETRSLERLSFTGIGAEVEGAYAYANEAKSREELWEAAERRAKEWITRVENAVDLGTRDDRGLLEPIRAYVQARANHIVALMDFNVALSELARVSGWDSSAPS